VSILEAAGIAGFHRVVNDFVGAELGSDRARLDVVGAEVERSENQFGPGRISDRPQHGGETLVGVAVAVRAEDLGNVFGEQTFEPAD